MLDFVLRNGTTVHSDGLLVGVHHLAVDSLTRAVDTAAEVALTLAWVAAEVAVASDIIIEC